MSKPDITSTLIEEECPKMGDDGGIKAVFVDTDLDTHFVLPVSSLFTVQCLKREICVEHSKCFPEFGDIKVKSVLVYFNENYYHLLDSMLLKTVFSGMGNPWFVFADVWTPTMPQNQLGFNQVEPSPKVPCEFKSIEPSSQQCDQSQHVKPPSQPHDLQDHSSKKKENGNILSNLNEGHHHASVVQPSPKFWLDREDSIEHLEDRGNKTNVAETLNKEVGNGNTGLPIGNQVRNSKKRKKNDTVAVPPSDATAAQGPAIPELFSQPDPDNIGNDFVENSAPFDSSNTAKKRKTDGSKQLILNVEKGSPLHRNNAPELLSSQHEPLKLCDEEKEIEEDIGTFKPGNTSKENDHCAEPEDTSTPEENVETLSKMSNETQKNVPEKVPPGSPPKEQLDETKREMGPPTTVGQSDKRKKKSKKKQPEESKETNALEKVEHADGKIYDKSLNLVERENDVKEDVPLKSEVSSKEKKYVKAKSSSVGAQDLFGKRENDDQNGRNAIKTRGGILFQDDISRPEESVETVSAKVKKSSRAKKALFPKDPPESLVEELRDEAIRESPPISVIPSDEPKKRRKNKHLVELDAPKIVTQVQGPSTYCDTKGTRLKSDTIAKKRKSNDSEEDGGNTASVLEPHLESVQKPVEREQEIQEEFASKSEKPAKRKRSSKSKSSAAQIKESSSKRSDDSREIVSGKLKKSSQSRKDLSHMVPHGSPLKKQLDEDTVVQSDKPNNKNQKKQAVPVNDLLPVDEAILGMDAPRSVEPDDFMESHGKDGGVDQNNVIQDEGHQDEGHQDEVSEIPPQQVSSDIKHLKRQKASKHEPKKLDRASSMDTSSNEHNMAEKCRPTLMESLVSQSDSINNGKVSVDHASGNKANFQMQKDGGVDQNKVIQDGGHQDRLSEYPPQQVSSDFKHSEKQRARKHKAKKLDQASSMDTSSIGHTLVEKCRPPLMESLISQADSINNGIVSVDHASGNKANFQMQKDGGVDQNKVIQDGGHQDRLSEYPPQQVSSDFKHSEKQRARKHKAKKLDQASSMDTSSIGHTLVEKCRPPLMESLISQADLMNNGKVSVDHASGNKANFQMEKDGGVDQNKVIQDEGRQDGLNEYPPQQVSSDFKHSEKQLARKHKAKKLDQASSMDTSSNGHNLIEISRPPLMESLVSQADSINNGKVSVEHASGNRANFSMEIDSSKRVELADDLSKNSDGQNQKEMTQVEDDNVQFSQAPHSEVSPMSPEAKLREKPQASKKAKKLDPPSIDMSSNVHDLVGSKKNRVSTKTSELQGSTADEKHDKSILPLSSKRSTVPKEAIETRSSLAYASKSPSKTGVLGADDRSESSESSSSRSTLLKIREKMKNKQPPKKRETMNANRRRSSCLSEKEVVNTPAQKKGLLASSEAIFDDSSSSSSDGDDEKTDDRTTGSSLSTTMAPDNSSSSDYSEGESKSVGTLKDDSSKGNGKNAYSSGFKLESILKSSSRYKKAKLVASQTQDESQPLEFVPDSQGDL